MLIFSIKKIFPVALIILLTAGISFAQDKTPPVKEQVKSALKDSTATDTTKSKKKGDITAIVYSTAADSMLFNVKSKKMQVYGKGDIKYKQTELKSSKIYVDYNTNEVEAYGKPDSSGKSLVETPILTEGTDVYEGQWMRYNFKTLRGFISAAVNKAKSTRYEGEKVKKVAQDTYFIENGMFTTCDEKEPHTYFTASEMKVIIDDKIIGKWILMHICGIPIPLPIPMAVIPNQTGRRSGIIMPGYGSDVNRGLYLSHFGYFFALSDYYDLSLTADAYSRGGYSARGRFRYNKRYDFNGEFNAGFTNVIGTTNPSKDWNLSLNHTQTIDPTTNLTANLQFQSSSGYNRYNSSDYSTILNQVLNSTATLSKNFEDLNASLSINYSRTQNNSNGLFTEILPSISFTKQMFYPFKSKNKEGVLDEHWYDLISVSYSGNFEIERSRQTYQRYDTISAGSSFSVNTINFDSTVVRSGAKHLLNIGASPKIGYITLAPSINYTELWYDSRIEKSEVAVYDSVTHKPKYTVVQKEVKGINFVRTFTLNISASTKLYGILPVNMLGIEAFRHTIMPSIGYSFNPNFSSDFWGYYGSYTDHNGKNVRYDRYQNYLYGGVSTYESQAISFNVANVFELKTAKDPTDTTSQSNKIQLLNLSLGTSYNFTRDSLKLAPLDISFNTSIGNLLSFNGNAIYTFYRYNNNLIGPSPINTFLASSGGGLLRITSFNFSVMTSLSGEKEKSDSDKKTTPQNDEGMLSANHTTTPDMINPNAGDSPDYSIPWTLSLSFMYSSNSDNPSAAAIIYSSINTNFSVNLTKKWKIGISGNYDIQNKQVLAPQITIGRDLHCWEMSLRWNPLGAYRGFYFIIRMKASEFQDIKVEKTEGLFSGLR